MTLRIVVITILLSGLGCGQDHSAPSNPSHEPSEIVDLEQELYCNSGSNSEVIGVVESCLSDEPEISKSLLTRHLQRLADSSPSWSARYLETQNFNRRYGLNKTQLQCLKQNLCKEYL